MAHGNSLSTRKASRSLRAGAVAFATAAAIAATARAAGYTTVGATWNGGNGSWTNAAAWSTSPAYPNNLSPANTVYNVAINSGSVTLNSGTVNVDSVTIAANGALQALTISGILNLAQPDNAGAPGILSASGSAEYAIFLEGGTIANATLDAPDGVSSVGVIYIPPAGASGTVQNVTLGSDFSIGGDETTLNVLNSGASPQGINLNAHTLTIVSANVNFQDAIVGTTDVGELLDHGTLNLQSSPVTASGSLTIGSAGTVVLTGGAGINGQSVTNNGHVNVGNGVFSDAAYITSESFTNGATGVITVYSGSTLDIDSANFVNNGTLQTSEAAGFTPASSGGATIAFNGGWINNGTINIASNDFIFYGGSALAGGTGTVNVNGGQMVGASNTGSINVGSPTVIAVAAAFVGPSFTNSGTITVYHRSQLTIGQDPTVANPLVTNFNNTGTIITANALGGGLTQGSGVTLSGNWSNSNLIEVGGGDTLNLTGSWSNSGTIQAGAGATVNLYGTFNASDVGLASAGSGGTFNHNGAAVNLWGTLINTGNNLVFGPASGVWAARDSFGVQAAIRGGTLSVLDQADGTAYLQPDFLILENVTLGSDYNLRKFQLGIASAVAGEAGLVANGHAINVYNSNGYVNFDSNNIFPVNADSFDGIINLYGQGSGVSTTVTFTLTSLAVINALAPATSPSQGNSLSVTVNEGHINAGSPTISGAVFYMTVANNLGTITAYTGDTVNIQTNSQIWKQNGVLAALAGGTINVTALGLPGKNLELASTSVLNLQLGDSGETGLLTFTGNLILDPGATLTFAELDGTAFSGSYDIINYTGTLDGTFTNVSPGYLVDYSHAGEILVTAVPEPSTLAVLGLAALLTLRGRKRDEA